jgi:hypothetical protein
LKPDLFFDHRIKTYVKKTGGFFNLFTSSEPGNEGWRTPHEKTCLQTQIAATDRPIDRLVYDLYGLTEEEIKIVEKQK